MTPMIRVRERESEGICKQSRRHTDSKLISLASLCLSRFFLHHIFARIPSLAAVAYEGSESDDLEPGPSPDITGDMDFMGGHRRRSNTAQRLDRLKKERRNQAKIKVIHWKDNCASSPPTSM